MKYLSGILYTDSFQEEVQSVQQYDTIIIL